MSPVRIVFLILLLSYYLLTTQITAAEHLTSSTELIFLNWSDYIDPALIREFEHKFNARIEEIYFDSDDTRDEMLVRSNGSGYDIVVVNGAQIDSYRKRGWLAPLGADKAPNLKNINPRWNNLFPAAGGYCAPYFIGTLGIAYRADLVPYKIAHWRQLFEPNEALRGRIDMNNSSRDVIGMALKALGYSANSTDLDALNQVQALLLAQKPYVRTYSYPALNENSSLVTGEAIISMLYSGDALILQKYNSNIVFVLPQEGGNFWVDYLCIMQASEQQELALAFINFLNEPENAARLAAYVHYQTPNSAAEHLLPTNILQHPVIYPDGKALRHSEIYTELPPRILKKRNSIFALLLQ